MSRRLLLAAAYCCGLLLGSPAYAQQEPRSILVVVGADGRMTPDTISKSTSVRQKRYWADQERNAIRRSNPDGNNAEDVIAGLNVPYGLSFNAQTQEFLWTSSGGEVVQKLAAGAKAPVNLPSAFEEPYALLVEDGERQVAYAVVNHELIRTIQYDVDEAEERTVLAKLDPDEPVHGIAFDADAGRLHLGNAAGMMSRYLNLSDNKLQILSFVDYGRLIFTEDPEAEDSQP